MSITKSKNEFAYTGANPLNPITYDNKINDQQFLKTSVKTLLWKYVTILKIRLAC